MPTTIKTKERGWPAHAHEVRAILDGRQSQFRRVVKPQPSNEMRPMPHGIKEEPKWGQSIAGYLCGVDGVKDLHGSGRHKPWRCPFGKPGDRLWVRETWAIVRKENGNRGRLPAFEYESYKEHGNIKTGEGSWIEGPFIDSKYYLHYRADNAGDLDAWRPSTNMPRWTSRITLEVTDVKVQRLHDMTDTDAEAEGAKASVLSPPYRFRSSFQLLWDSINCKRGLGWDVNPFVWVVSFKRAEA